VLAGSGVTRESLLASAAQQREVREVRGQSGERKREKREREREREGEGEGEGERERERGRGREGEGGVTRPGVLTDAQPMYVSMYHT
jgi:hypothetical protein